MIHWKLHTIRLDFEGDCEWEGVHQDPQAPNKYIIIYKGGTWPYSAFEADAWELPIEEVKRIWGITNIQTLGKSHCKAGYTDRLHPEKSWTGHNPATLEKLKRYMEQLEKEEKENGS